MEKIQVIEQGIGDTVDEEGIDQKRNGFPPEEKEQNCVFDGDGKDEGTDKGPYQLAHRNLLLASIRMIIPAENAGIRKNQTKRRIVSGFRIILSPWRE